MEIAENLSTWLRNYQNGWLKKYSNTNKIDWKLYDYIKNISSPINRGIELSTSKLMLISSSGAYLPGYDKPFDSKNPLGDYSIKTISTSTQLSELDYSHDHYDTSAVKEDPDILIPIRHLQIMKMNGILGKLSERMISFMGYQPDVGKVVTETIPLIVDIVKKDNPGAVLLVPS